jgi:BirA family biotin operon repressor/biotin-[acetyl-CoA-carboxylase] ligase
MSNEPLPGWGAEALWSQLEPLLPGLSVEIVRSTASTNTALLERARASGHHRESDAIDVAQVRRSVEGAAFGRRAIDVQPCLLVAEHQSDGRGRQGRSWQSRAGASLTFSLSVPLAPADWSGLSLVVGMALAEALDPTSAPKPQRIGLKWPNDLWLRDTDGVGVGRKLGGILIETVAVGPQRLAVIGIGLNVGAFETHDASSGFATLQEIDPGTSAPTVLARVALPLVQALKRFEAEGFGAFAEGYAARDLLRDRPVRTTQAIEGIAQGVSAQGALRVLTPAGLELITSGEVSVRLAGDAAAR